MMLAAEKSLLLALHVPGHTCAFDTPCGSWQIDVCTTIWTHRKSGLQWKTPPLVPDSGALCCRPLTAASRAELFQGLLGGSWVVIGRVISRVSILITHIRGLITLLIATFHTRRVRCAGFRRSGRSRLCQPLQATAASYNYNS